MDTIRYIISWVNRNRSHLLSVSFFVGFVVDNLTLNSVDDRFDNIILAVYVVLIMVAILTMYSAIAEKLPEKITPFLRNTTPYLMQFAFGGLLSGMLIFYSRSGSFSSSWPFLVIIVSVIVGNELLSRRANRLVFNLSVFFIALFSYIVLIIPVLTGKMGDVTFVISSIIALAIFILFVHILARVIPHFILHHMRWIVFTTGSIFAIMQFLYFTNLIPPIPLSLKDVGIYHNVERLKDGRYLLTYEEQPWWRFRLHSDKTFTKNETSTPYCYSSVFAPAKLSINIVHEWQFFNKDTRQWEVKSIVPYPISGGRAEGYRGYSYKNSYETGKWRCVVRTERGQIVGYETFMIRDGALKDLKTTIR